MLLQAVVCGRVQCYISFAMLAELREVLQRPKFGLSSEQVLAFVQELQEVCQVVSPTKRVHVVSADPDDDAVLECALEASAKLIASGDEHLLQLVQWRGVRMLSPADALAVIEV